MYNESKIFVVFERFKAYCTSRNLQVTVYLLLILFILLGFLLYIIIISIYFYFCCLIFQYVNSNFICIKFQSNKCIFVMYMYDLV